MGEGRGKCGERKGRRGRGKNGERRNGREEMVSHTVATLGLAKGPALHNVFYPTCMGKARILRFFGGEGFSPGHGERGSASLYRDLGAEPPAGVQGAEYG